MEEIPLMNSKDDNYSQNDENSNDAPAAVKKRKLDDLHDDILPPSYRHIRNYERRVKDRVYRTLGDLMGKGLSKHEAVQAVITVSNKLFDRNWKEH